jgi:hypothetical protein
MYHMAHKHHKYYVTTAAAAAPARINAAMEMLWE